MRIGIDGMLLTPPFSGVERAILGTARCLAAAGRESYRLYLPAGGVQDPPSGPRFESAFVRIPARLQPIRILWEQFRLPLRLRRDGTDMLHAPGYLAPLRCRLPIVLTVYDLIALDFPGLCRTGNALNYRLLLPCSIRRAARIIVPSEATARDVRRRFPEAAPRLRVIPLGVSNAFRRVSDPQRLQEVRRRYRLPRTFVLFLGTLEPKKNVPRLLRVYHTLRCDGSIPHALVVAGAMGWDRHAIRATLRRTGLGPDTHFPGTVADADLPVLYSLAEAFFFPSLYEGFGFPVLEAMACGVPVVCSNRGALPELVADAAVCVNPQDVPGMANALRNLLASGRRLDDLRRRGPARAAAYRWEDTAARTEACFASLNEGRGPDFRGPS